MIVTQFHPQNEANLVNNAKFEVQTPKSPYGKFLCIKPEF
jgi:hypothetical protein